MLKLSAFEQDLAAGKHGPAKQWAMRHQIDVANYFGAAHMVPVSDAHMMGDIEVMGVGGLGFLRGLAADAPQTAVPTTTNARCVDFAAARRLLQSESMVEQEREIIALLRSMGIIIADTCINYQTMRQPYFGEHVAWGDTGTVIYANSVFGARSNFESGPSALAAALTGRTPCYGFHLDEHRRGTVLVEVRAKLEDYADWGALGAVIGRRFNSYWQVPVLSGMGTVPSSDHLKHLGASLASFGSFAMFHAPGITPEACDESTLFGPGGPQTVEVVDDRAIAAVYESFRSADDRVDLVVLTGPQLSVYEIRYACELLGGRRVSSKTRLILTTNRQNYELAESLGYVQAILDAGGMVLVGVCFYLMAPGRMRERFNWRTVMTNSAKFANIIGGYRYESVLASTATCIDSAVAGRIRREDRWTAA